MEDCGCEIETCNAIYTLTYATFKSLNKLLLKNVNKFKSLYWLKSWLLGAFIVVLYYFAFSLLLIPALIDKAPITKLYQF